MTIQPNNTGGDAASMAAVSPREYLYFVSYVSMGRFGNCYLTLNFAVETSEDVTWVRDELGRQGLANAVVLSFALLPKGWSRR